MPEVARALVVPNPNLGRIDPQRRRDLRIANAIRIVRVRENISAIRTNLRDSDTRTDHPVTLVRAHERSRQNLRGLRKPSPDISSLRKNAIVRLDRTHRRVEVAVRGQRGRHTPSHLQL